MINISPWYFLCLSSWLWDPLLNFSLQATTGWTFLSSYSHFQNMVSFLLRRPFVKLLQIFSISNAAVTCQTEIRMLCSKAETFLSMCARWRFPTDISSRDSCLHFESSSHLGRFHSLKRFSPFQVPEVSPTIASTMVSPTMLEMLLPLSSTSPGCVPVRGVQACFTDIQMEVEKD